MDTPTAHILNAINKEFYARNADTFSQTRTQGWQGWERLIEVCGIPESVLDIACGNMRFKRFIQETAPDAKFAYYGVDASDALASCGISAHYQNLDIIGTVLDGQDARLCVEAPQCELVVSFGFMHHVPGMDARKRIMDLIAQKTVEGGTACLSFWRFMEERTLQMKARKVTEQALRKLSIVLDEGDWFLDWQGNETSLRYCHSFTDDEIDMLLDRVSGSCKVVERYRADGRNSALNTYVVLRNA